MSTKHLLTRDEVLFFANRFVEDANKEDFLTRLADEASVEPIPQSPEDLIDLCDKMQVKMYDNIIASADENPIVLQDGETAIDGEEVVSQLRTAVQRFPDADVRRAIIQICVLVETKTITVTQTTPALQHLAEASAGAAAASGGSAHGHSHDGRPCDGSSHGHNHQSAHGHSHNGKPCDGSSHGHSHGGHGHNHSHGGQPTPEMMNLMALAMQTLSPQQQETVQRVQNTMNSGSPPSPQDMQDMFGIQQHIMAFMNTMRQFTGDAGSA